MSVMRLVMLDTEKAVSGLVPSHAVNAILAAIAKKASDIESFWQTISAFDADLQEYFNSNLDSSPLLEGIDDGLLVISWEHHCVESFQKYQPLWSEGAVRYHDGNNSVESDNIENYTIELPWHIIDHYFEESRH